VRVVVLVKGETELPQMVATVDPVGGIPDPHYGRDD
jgi:hypothetical protein